MLSTPSPNLPPEPPTIRLDQFLKLTGLVQSGGEAKFRVQAGEVQVNGAVEQRRGRKLVAGDQVTLNQESHRVELP